MSIVTSSADLAIDLHHVAKTYRGRIQALRGVSMQVGHGEIFGLLGPNGAGKSTLVKIMMTVVRPNRAEGTVLGQPIGHKPTLGRVGYLPENHRFPRYLTGRQTLEYFAALSEVDRPTRRRRAAELLELVGMSAWADHKVGTYSKGMMQRVGLANALVADPDLVLLDEPTDGVDPVGRLDIRNALLAMKARGKSVLVNSHLLSELEMVCDRVAILVKGVVARQGTIDGLTIAKQHYAIELVDATGLNAGELKLDGITVEIEGQLIRVGTTDPGMIQPLIDHLRAGGRTIKAVQPMRPSLEELFMDVVKDPENGRGLASGAAPGFKITP